jgi:hypothetical protein
MKIENNVFALFGSTSQYYPGIYLEEPRKTRKILFTIAGFRAEIWNQEHLNTKQECQPLDCNCMSILIISPSYTLVTLRCES